MSKSIFTLASIFCLAFSLLGCSSLPQTKSVSKEELAEKNRPHKILFIKEHWHTSIVLDAPSLLAAMPELSAELTNQPYVRVGWGDGDFFSGKSKSNLSATRALFLSSYSAMQVLAYDEWPEDDFDENDRVTLWIADSGFKKLIAFLRASFAFDTEGSLKRLQSYQKNTGSFFVAKEHYSVFNNCNSWTGKALQSANLPVGFHLTPSGLLQDAKNMSREQRLSAE